MKDYKHLKDEFNELKKDRANWDMMYQTIGQYVSLIKQNFQTQHQAGEFLGEEVYDSTGVFAAHASASALLGMLWPGSAKQAIEITAPDDLEITTSLSQFYDRMTSRLVRAMDDPRANLQLSLDEYMLDEIIFGTAGVGAEKGEESKLLYMPKGLKEMYIDEGRNGLVNVMHLLYEWRLRRVVEEYGEEKLSQKLKDKVKAGKLGEMVKILNVIKPRKQKGAEKGKFSMPFESIHMEYDSCHLLKEDGYEEFPAPVGRFRKLNYERYGRSPAMNALPDIREANILREAVIMATEKALEMPKGVYHDGVFGNGVIDLSPNSVTVFNPVGLSGNQQPIFDIGSPPNIPWAEARLEKLEQNIAKHFSIDKLLDFNNETQMTFGEAQIRDQIRTAALSSLFSRQISEVFTPLIARSVNILWRMGEFGVIRGSEEEAEALALGKEPEYIPDELVERLEAGEDIYQINYKTKAANAAKAEDYIAILDVLNFSIQAMQVDPSIRNRVDLHKAIKELSSIRSLPAGIIRQDDEVEQIEAAEAEQAQAQAGLNQAQQISEIAKNAAPLIQ